MSERIISEFETKANKCKNCMVCQSGEINSDVIKTKMKPILYVNPAYFLLEDPGNARQRH